MKNIEDTDCMTWDPIFGSRYVSGSLAHAQDYENVIQNAKGYKRSHDMNLLMGVFHNELFQLLNNFDTNPYIQEEFNLACSRYRSYAAELSDILLTYIIKE